MSTTPYKIKVRSPNVFTFTSDGPRGTFEKMVVISPLEIRGYYNLGFGDIRPDGCIDDKSETNNGDLIRVFATVIFIIEQFLDNNPNCTVYFAGSTFQRTMVYSAILKRYYSRFTEKYIISGEIRVDDTFVEVEFNPREIKCYEAFLVRKKW